MVKTLSLFYVSLFDFYATFCIKRQRDNLFGAGFNLSIDYWGNKKKLLHLARTLIFSSFFERLKHLQYLSNRSSIFILFPLEMDETTNTKSQNGNKGGDGNKNGEHVT